MKKYIFIALAAIAALSSCSKESLVSNEENGKEARVFTATMEDGITTKVTFDGTNKCAHWEIGDAISIDGNTYIAQQTGASSTFTGSGATEPPHHAYFPANLYNGGTPTLPAEQTYAEGKFNMPMYAESSSLELSFKNLCAVLAITVKKSNLVSTTTTSLKSIKVSSDKRMHGAFTTTSEGVLSLSQAALTDTDKSVTLTMTDDVDISTDKTFYIAIPAQEYSYLKIFLSADGSTYKEAMITQKAAGLGTLARSTMFNIPYKTNAVQIYANGPYWSTMNIGATAETGFGLYFGWGEKTGHALTTDAQSTLASYSYEVDEITNAFEGNHSFSSPNPTIDGDNQNPEILPASNDAATVNWGAAWRMPTGKEGEFKALNDNTESAWTNDYNSTGVKGRTFTGKDSYSGITLFFPAAGLGYDTSLSYAGSCGAYWSSARNKDNIDLASSLGFDSDNVGPDDRDGRFYGYSVRPVSTEGVAPAPTPTEPEYVEMKMGTGEGAYTLKWATMNLGATEETDYGRYYAWGDIIGQTAATSGAYAFATAFSWANCPFNNGEFYYDETYFSSVKETVCPGGVLKSDYDVAHKVLGGDWRMPTKEEFEALYAACGGSYDKTTTNPSGASASVGKGVYWCTSYDGVAGCLFCDGTNKLFFPAAGNGNETYLYAGFGFYCSSSLYSSPDSSPENPSAQYAYTLIFDDIEVNPQNYGGRCCGFTVRPVSD